jgi:hypothetical protein
MVLNIVFLIDEIPAGVAGQGVHARGPPGEGVARRAERRAAPATAIPPSRPACDPCLSGSLVFRQAGS